MVVVLSGEAVASHASFVYQPKPADPEEVELAASAKSFLWRKHKPWACMPVRQSKLFTLDEQTAKRRPEEPGGLLVPPGIARSRMASLAVTATQEAASPSGSVGPTQRSAASAYGLDRRLLSRSPAIAHQRR